MNSAQRSHRSLLSPRYWRCWPVVLTTAAVDTDQPDMPLADGDVPSVILSCGAVTIHPSLGLHPPRLIDRARLAGPIASSLADHAGEAGDKQSGKRPGQQL
jgi:hypothetical protein